MLQSALGQPNQLVCCHPAGGLVSVTLPVPPCVPLSAAPPASLSVLHSSCRSYTEPTITYNSAIVGALAGLSEYYDVKPWKG